MANLDHLINGAAKATGDDIVAAGLFQPKGMAGSEVIGMTAGAVLGDAVGGEIGQTVGMAAGEGAALASKEEHGAIRFVLAISPSKIYVLKPSSFDALHKEELEVLQTFDRKTAEITVHARVTVRTIVIEDPATGEKAELEGGRLWFKHAKPVLSQLLEPHFEDDESQLEASNA